MYYLNKNDQIFKIIITIVLVVQMIVRWNVKLSYKKCSLSVFLLSSLFKNVIRTNTLR